MTGRAQWHMASTVWRVAVATLLWWPTPVFGEDQSQQQVQPPASPTASIQENLQQLGTLQQVGSLQQVGGLQPGDVLPNNARPGELLPPTLLPPNALPSNITPPGTDIAAGPGEAAGFVAYQPIVEGLLPRSGQPADQTTTPSSPSVSVPTTTNLGAPAINWGPYTLGPDDVVHVAVRNQPEFTGMYVIGHDGNIQFGFLGDVKADGLTKEELARAVEERLRRYVRVPSVYVTIVGFNSKAIYILGRVQRPGKYAMRGDSVKIRDAVIAAGLMVRHAKLRKVHIVKSDPKDPSFRIVDLQKVLYKGVMKNNIDLVAGDIVVIPTTVWGGINDFLSELISASGHAGSVAGLAAL